MPSAIIPASARSRSSDRRRWRSTSTSARRTPGSACRRSAARRTSSSSCRTPISTGRSAIISESFYGCAGERCLAGSMLVPVGDAHREARDRLVEAAKALKVGDGTQPGVTMGPVISAKHRERVVGYIDKGRGGRREAARRRPPDAGAGSAERLFRRPDRVRRRVAGDGHRPRGDLRTGRVDLPGKTLDEAIALMQSHPNANATSIFTSSGKAAREFASTRPRRWSASTSASPRRWRTSRSAARRTASSATSRRTAATRIEFYTDKKVTISRWF